MGNMCKNLSVGDCIQSSLFLSYYNYDDLTLGKLEGGKYIEFDDKSKCYIIFKDQEKTFAKIFYTNGDYYLGYMYLNKKR